YRHPDAHDYSDRRRTRQCPPAARRGCHFPWRPGFGQVCHSLLREAGGAHCDNGHAERIRQALRCEGWPQVLEPGRAYNPTSGIGVTLEFLPQQRERFFPLTEEQVNVRLL